MITVARTGSALLTAINNINMVCEIALLPGKSFRFNIGNSAECLLTTISLASTVIFSLLDCTQSTGCNTPILLFLLIYTLCDVLFIALT